MSSEAQNVIADVIGKHRLEKGMRMGRGERVEWWYCLECEWRSEDFDLDDSGGSPRDRASQAHACGR
ncbi:hypothetical protein SEA_GIRR_79 [Mycobacterium phage Girr]|uniref:Uncharacterized protein n=1 Tax=Mycobacterium phage Girr TaxID=2301565 RepID=A0A385DQA7_9CAUD|nr:hypothetical protein I5H43_gp079 [Mycobacterium phage Girr]AXQ61027.1 hypothetical protein SEA_GIRR_79 [Mycobacterium phage Girr]AXQ65119.1 hypothetical protein SEA_RUBY_77 [Mycobacterium phage Ruby]QAY06115.1 hypothetical protein SEA_MISTERCUDDLES_80 [Mycobacterium phage MisterCuddles]